MSQGPATPCKRSNNKMSEQPTPALSVVVAIVSDTIDRRADPRHLRECLEKLQQQSGAPPMEVIVPYYPPIIDVEPLTREFPEVRFIPISDLKTYSGQAGGREHHDELRARGLAFAHGETIALLEDHGHVCDGWARTAVAFRNTEYGGVGGAIDSGIDRPLNTAVYYCDFFRYQSPVVEGESFLASDANVAYRRDALE